MMVAAVQPAIGGELVRVGLEDHAFGDEALEDLGERQSVVLHHLGGGLHGREYSQPPWNGQAF